MPATVLEVLRKLGMNGWFDVPASKFTPEEKKVLDALCAKQIVIYYPEPPCYGDYNGRALNLYRQLGGK